MNLLRLTVSLLCLTTLAVATTHAQSPPLTRSLIVVDPAHGGPDNGSHLQGNLLEKDINLALANRLKAALIARGFQVATTRDGDTNPTADQRAEFANQRHPLACILIHSSAAGFGPYLAASALAPDSDTRIAIPWDTAQAFFVSDSLALLNVANNAFTSGKVPAITLRSSVPPIDSLTCPAILLELAPLSNAALSDVDYQQKAVDSLAAAVSSWREQADTTITRPTPAITPKPKPAAPAPSAKITGAAK